MSADSLPSRATCRSRQIAAESDPLTVQNPAAVLRRCRQRLGSTSITRFPEATRYTFPVAPFDLFTVTVWRTRST